jgi:ArsR family transcriptional regulator, arsenate/arsenite/antimonite-responsive transcriptional repressor
LVQGEIDGPRSCYCIDWSALKELRDLLGTLFSGLDAGSRNRCC